jgi:hypothetical protein
MQVSRSVRHPVFVIVLSRCSRMPATGRPYRVERSYWLLPTLTFITFFLIAPRLQQAQGRPALVAQESLQPLQRCQVATVGCPALNAGQRLSEQRLSRQPVARTTFAHLTAEQGLALVCRRSASSVRLQDHFPGG